MLGHIRASKDGEQEDRSSNCIRKNQGATQRGAALLKMGRAQFFPKIFYFKSIPIKLVFPL